MTPERREYIVDAIKRITDQIMLLMEGCYTMGQIDTMAEEIRKMRDRHEKENANAKTKA